MIRCPDCGFERTIDPEAIAPSAVRATCPRCKTKFYFRNPDGSFVDFDAEPARSGASAPSFAPTETAPKRPAASVVPPASMAPMADGDDDPLPPGAVVPDMPHVPGMTQPTDEEQPGTDPADTGPARTISAGPPPEKKAQAASDVDASATARDVRTPRSSERPAARSLKPAPAAKPGLFSIFEKTLQDTKARLGKTHGETPESYHGQQADGDDPRPASRDSKPDAKSLSSFLPDDDNVPWELQQQYGVVRGLYQTILRVLFGAPRFFASLRLTTTPWIRPVTFYVILGMFQTFMERTWYLMSFQAMGPSIADPKVQELLGAMAHEMSLPMALILAPATLFMQLAFYSSLFYLMVRLVQPESASFQLILRVIAYSAAPAVVCVVPLMGSLANAVWFAVCCCAGCKYALNMPWSRVLLALGPLYLVAFAVLGQFMRQIMG